VKRFFRTLMLLAIAVCLPGQAIALPALALLCEQDPMKMHSAMHAHHGEHDHHDHSGHHGDGGDGSAPPAPHACCHHLLSAALPTFAALSDSAPSGVVATALFHPEFLIPDRLKRPPLAGLV
jgi:hypothetical protein